MKAKRILSLALCLVMLCGLFTVGTFSASALELNSNERVLDNFDDESNFNSFGPNNQGFTDSTGIIDYAAEYDPEYTEGNVFYIWSRDAVNYGGWVFNLNSNWASDDYDVPVGLKFQVWADKENTATLYKSSGLAANQWASWNPSDVKSRFNELGMNDDLVLTTEPQWIELDLTDLKVLYNERLGMRLNIGGSGVRVFMDNVVLVYEEVSNRKASFDVEGIEDIAVDAAGYVTLPSAAVAGKQFIGWQDEAGNLYKDGTKLRLAKTTAFSAVAADIALQTGAGIRWAEKEEERGIRFETYVTKDALDILGSSRFEIGALILPYADYNADITVDTAADYGAVNVVDPNVFGKTSDGYYRYYTGVVDFERYFAVSQSALADMKLTAVSYVKVTYKDGTASYFYDHPDATDNVRSVAEVARAALADTEFGYTDGQIAILNLYNQYSQETSVPSYRNDPRDNPNAIEEVEFANNKWLDKSGGNNGASYDNGATINQYTPAGTVDHYYADTLKTIKFTLPESIAYGEYAISFNTRGYTSRAASVKVEVSSEAGSFVAGDNMDFRLQDTSGSLWYKVTAPTSGKVKGTTTITITNNGSSGNIYLYDVVLTPVF